MAGDKVMIVDDDEEFLEELQDVLAAYGYEAITVNDSTRAVAMASQLQPKILLLDLTMDKLDGFQVAEKLKKLPKTRNIPIIAVTGFYPPQGSLCFENHSEIKMILEKPIDPVALITTIEKVVRERK